MASVRMARRAVREARAARAWYEARNPAAAEGFDRELAGVIQLVADHPLIAPSINVRGARRLRFSTYPYSMIYRIESLDVVIIAVRHARWAPLR